MDYFSRIILEFPEFIGSSMRLVSDGAENDVVIVNEKTVFRFPKIERTKRTMLRELQLLEVCAKHISLPIPAPKYTKSGLDFWGYEMIDGIEPKAKDVADFPHLAKEIATIMNELHQIPISELKESGLKLPTKEKIQEDIEWLRGKYDIISEYLSEAQIITLDTLAEEYLLYLPPIENLALMHDDLAGNLLWSPESKHITGLLDFSGAQIYDPASDFTIFMEWDADIWGLIYSHYYGQSESFRQRMDFQLRRHYILKLPKICRDIEKNGEKGKRRLERAMKTLGI